MDALYPNTFNFAKVKWGAKHEHEFVENYKILQAAFDKNGVKRFIEVGKLVKAKYQDNLEFCQWLKAYFEKNFNG
jgi:RP/EB family microtubule-associated protein